jgi:uncharacterized GH25 family protein
MRITRDKTSSARYGRRLAVAAVAVVAVASTAAAHDFWIIPDMFEFGTDASMHINGRQGGGKFPEGTAVQPERVVDARIIGATSSSKITEMSVVGASLKLHHKPTTPGQYVIAVGLAPRVFRETPVGVVRFLRAEGGAAEAARLERENTFAGLDSVIFTAASYATTMAEVGQDGPRAFTKAAGLRLEFVPVNDPSHLHVGDTLHVRMLGNGSPVAGLGVELATGLDSAEATAASVTRVPFTADRKGVVHIPLTKAGPVMLRSAYASRKAGGAAREWDVSRTTFVFNVSAQH